MKTKVNISATVAPDVLKQFKEAIKKDQLQLSPVIEALMELYIDLQNQPIADLDNLSTPPPNDPFEIRELQ